MGKKRRILVAALVLAALGGLAGGLFLWPSPEPVYEGKRLSAWLADYAVSGGGAYPASEDPPMAVRHIGTNAIPTLLRMLRARDSALALKLLALAQKQHFVRIEHVEASAPNLRAAAAFGALGAEGKGAVPAVMKIYDENISRDSRLAALQALSNVGPAAKEAVPLLLRVAAQTNIDSLYTTMLRCTAIYALGSIHAQPESVVPGLTTMLRDSDVDVRLQAVWVLRKFGPDAKPAVPRLFDLLKDADRTVREGAFLAIPAIDPEAARLRRAELDAVLVQMIQ